MNRSTIFALAWPATIVGAFVIGQLASSDSPSAKGNELSNRVSPPKLKPQSYVQPASAKGSGETVNTVLSRAISKARVTPSEFRKDFGISKIVRMNDPIKRSAMLLSMIEQMKAEDFEAVMTAFEKLSSPHEYRSERRQLMHAWAQLAPEAALSFVTESPRYKHNNYYSTSASQSIISAWARKDPQAAIAWARQNFEPGKDQRGKEKANPYLVGAIQGIASSDLYLASEMLVELPVSPERWQALTHISKHAASEGKENALAWLDSLEDETLKNAASNVIVGELSRTAPEEIADWVLTIEHASTRSSAMSRLASNWVRADLEKARAWSDSLEGSQRTFVAKTIVYPYARTDPHAAAAWMGEMKELEGYQDVLKNYISGANYSGNAELALDQVANITDERQRNQFYHRTLNVLARHNSESAKNWLETKGDILPESTRAQISRYIESLQK